LRAATPGNLLGTIAPEETPVKLILLILLIVLVVAFVVPAVRRGRGNRL
jgi:hypothetical protein